MNVSFSTWQAFFSFGRVRWARRRMARRRRPRSRRRRWRRKGRRRRRWYAHVRARGGGARPCTRRACAWRGTRRTMAPPRRSRRHRAGAPPSATNLAFLCLMMRLTITKGSKEPRGVHFFFIVTILVTSIVFWPMSIMNCVWLGNVSNVLYQPVKSFKKATYIQSIYKYLDSFYWAVINRYFFFWKIMYVPVISKIEVNI